MPVRTLIVCGLLASAPVQAQNEAPPVAPPPAQPAGEPVKPRKSGIPPSAERENHERLTRELLQKLPPEKRQQVLQSMKKVWADEDVRAAREDLRRATEAYRRTLRAAMEEIDPDVREALRPLLDRLPEAGLSPGVSPLRADKSSAGGPPRYLRLLGLSGDTVGALTPQERDLLASVRERVMTDPRVRQAAAALAAKPDQPGGRAQAMKEFRRVTRTVAVELEPRLQPLLEKAGAAPK